MSCAVTTRRLHAALSALTVLTFITVMALASPPGQAADELNITIEMKVTVKSDDTFEASFVITDQTNYSLAPPITKDSCTLNYFLVEPNIFSHAETTFVDGKDKRVCTIATKGKISETNGTIRHENDEYAIDTAVACHEAGLLAVAVCLGALTIPGLGLRTALPNSGQHTAGAPDRITYDLISQHFGVGRNGPLVLTADVISSRDPLKLVADLKEEVEAIDGVAAVPLATPNQNAEVAMLQVVPTTGPDDPADCAPPPRCAPSPPRPRCVPSS